MIFNKSFLNIISMSYNKCLTISVMKDLGLFDNVLYKNMKDLDDEDEGELEGEGTEGGGEGGSGEEGVGSDGEGLRKVFGRKR